jgi:hypothetical protein
MDSMEKITVPLLSTIDGDQDGVMDSSSRLISLWEADEGDVAIFHAVIQTESGKVITADGDNKTHCGKVVGFCLTLPESGFVQVQKAGPLENPNWNLDPGEVYFLSTGGEISKSPSQRGFIQKIGIAKSMTKMDIELGEPIRRV